LTRAAETLRLGVQLPNLGLLEGREPLVRMSKAAEELGFDSLWTGDHVVLPVEIRSRYPYNRTGDYPNDSLVAFDALIALGVAAGCTERVQLGTSVLIVPIRNPLLLAKMLASLDVLSEGRVILGAGTGWLREEFEVLGAPDFAARGEVLEEWIAIMRACWSEDTPRFEGRHYSFPPVNFRPRPARPIPILLGGHSPAALRRVGRIGDGWFGTALPVEEVRTAIAEMREHARAAGRDPQQLVFACGYTVDIGGGEREHPRHLVGSPAGIAARLRELAAAGLDHIELRFAATRDPAGPSLERTLAQMETFAREVLPAVNG
jgi:probable F420-dependent oxidoreductase